MTTLGAIVATLAVLVLGMTWIMSALSEEWSNEGAGVVSWVAGWSLALGLALLDVGYLFNL